MNQQDRTHFVDIDIGWNPRGVIMHRGEHLVFVRNSNSASAPNLKDMRYPGHLLNLVQDAPKKQFHGQPAGTTALAVFQANVQGGGLLIASFGPSSAFDKRVESERHMPLTVY